MFHGTAPARADALEQSFPQNIRLNLVRRKVEAQTGVLRAERAGALDAGVAAQAALTAALDAAEGLQRRPQRPTSHLFSFLTCLLATSGHKASLKS